MAIVRIRAYGSRIGTGHTGPFHCDVAAVGKINRPHPLVVATEYICSRLAMHLGLPVPAGGIVTDVDRNVAPDGLGYVSLNFFPEGERPAPIDREALRTHQSQVAGLTVFDSWIVCGDRHANNVVMDADLGVPLTVIDFDLALLAHTHQSGLTYGQLQTMAISQLPHTLHDLVHDADYVRYWVHRVRSVSVDTIRQIVREAEEMRAIPAQDAEATVALLVGRQNSLATMLKSEWENGRAFPAIDEWGLF